MVESIRKRAAGTTALLLAGVFASCGDGESEPIGPPMIAEVPAPAQEPAAKPPHRLELRDGSGQEIVQVRSGRRVDLYEEPGGEPFLRVGDETEFGSPVVFAVARARAEWAAVHTPYRENGQLAWVRLDSRLLKSGPPVEWEVRVDLSDYQADLTLDGKRIRSFGVSIGAPGTETPTGEYAVTDTFRGGLNPAYGCCAVAITARQLNLPSGWLGGDRIAIHGTSGPIGSALSNGCVRARDADVSDLVDRLPLGTPVTVTQ